VSQENLELVRQVMETFTEAGMEESARRFFHVDGVFEEPPEQPSPAVARGRDAAIRTYRQFDEAWEEHRSDVEEMRVVDDERVLVLSLEHFRGRDGIEVTQPCGNLFTLREGKVIRLQSFWERANAFAAAGLEE
jgi:ketosteroid isomerase-like protein